MRAPDQVTASEPGSASSAEGAVRSTVVVSETEALVPGSTVSAKAARTRPSAWSSRSGDGLRLTVLACRSSRKQTVSPRSSGAAAAWLTWPALTALIGAPSAASSTTTSQATGSLARETTSTTSAMVGPCSRRERRTSTLGSAPGLPRLRAEAKNSALAPLAPWATGHGDSPETTTVSRLSARASSTYRPSAVAGRMSPLVEDSAVALPSTQMLSSCSQGWRWTGA